MKKLRKLIDTKMDDFKIRKKLYLMYILCVLVPLILTDSVIIYTVVHSEKVSRDHELENMANAVQYNFYNSIEGAAGLAKSIYTNKYIDSFLSQQYESPLEYVTSYQTLFKDTMLNTLKSGVMSDSYILTLYSDNETIVNGGEFEQLNTVKTSQWYRYLESSGMKKALYFEYDDSKSPTIDGKRRIVFLQRLDFYSDTQCEKILRLEIDYSSMTRNLQRMNYDTDVYICQGDRIILSNGKYSSVGKDFESFTQQNEIGYTQDMNQYGMDMKIYIMKPQMNILTNISNNIPLIFFLLLINIFLPFLMVHSINRSFTIRISELSETFRNIEGDQLVEISNVRGKDEIGILMHSYNRMARRINELIQIVYKNKIQEQEMLVARQNAELLALHSQINPHFLFNALESIRMHSIIKCEMETADMVEKLAIMQRQYVEWGNDEVEIAKEIEFVRAYLGLQKYRFGDRLSYEIEVEESCKGRKIPKLTIVTFVENACVHGIESKTVPGWIFVRIFQKAEWIYLEVEDTGCGMQEETAKELLYKMQNADITMLKDKGRVGIVNACLRLKMTSQNEVLFELEGEEGIGTLIQIRIPEKYI